MIKLIGKKETKRLWKLKEAHTPKKNRMDAKKI
jgi:hypothetical protein